MKISSILSVEPKIKFEPERPGEIGNFVANTDLLLSKFENKPETSIEDGLKQTILWSEKN